MTAVDPAVGILGGGFMAAVHSRAARAAGARLRAVVSSSPERSRQAAQALGIEAGYDSIDALLADDSIEVVHVCTPNALHAQQSLAVIAAGKQLICEKPLAATVGEAERVVAATRAADVVTTVPFVYRFHPMVREARARMSSGLVGRLHGVHGSYLQDWLLDAGDDNWRVDSALGGASRAFADIGSHLVDLVEFVTGDRISRLAAAKRTFIADRAQHRDITTEDAVAVVAETRGGAIATLHVSQVAPGRKNRLHMEFAGSAESIGFDQESPETLWIGRRRGSQLLPREAEQLHEDAARLSTVPAGHPMGYQDAFTAFVADSYAAMRGGSPEGLPRAEDGLRAADVTAAVMAAADTDGWIEVRGRDHD